MVPNQVGMTGMSAGLKKHVTIMDGTMYAVPAYSTEDRIYAATRYHKTQFCHSLSNSYRSNIKDAIEADIKWKLEKGQLVGIKL